MKKLNVIFILLVTCLAFASAVAAKPQPSLSMKIAWVDGEVFEQATKIRLEIYSQISSDKVNINLNLPEGVVLQRGDASSVGKVEKGQPLILEYVVYMEKTAAGRIKAEATIGEANQVFFRAKRFLQINNPSVSSKVGARSLSGPTYKHTERDGVRLREYTLP